MTEDLKTPDLSGLPLVMISDLSQEDCHVFRRSVKPVRHVSTRNGLHLVVCPSDGSWQTWRFIAPYTPPTLRPMTHKEIVDAIRAGAMVRWHKSDATNVWKSSNNIPDWFICRNWTGTDSDVWTNMEVEA
jgi:hypothetical protein